MTGIFLASGHGRGLLANDLHFLLLLLVDRWQVVCDNLVLPVVHHPVSLSLLRGVVLVLDVEPGVGLVVSDVELGEALSEQITSPATLVKQVLGVLLLLDVGLLPLDKCFDSCLFERLLASSSTPVG